MKNYNYFTKFGKENATLMALGRYVVYNTLRGTLPRDGVQENLDLFLRGWFQKHPFTTRIFYSHTAIVPQNIWAAGYARVFALGSPVPIGWTNGIQLYSLSGNGEELRWFELVMYLSIAKDFIQLVQGNSYLVSSSDNSWVQLVPVNMNLE